MIRHLTVNDKEEIADLVKEFFDEELSARGYIHKREFCIRDIESISKIPNRIALGIENDGKLQGIIVAIVVNRPFLGTSTAQELVWYVRKEYRKEGIRLLKAFESLANDFKVDDVTMIALKNTKAENIYARFGYSEYETMYVKKLN